MHFNIFIICYEDFEDFLKTLIDGEGGKVAPFYLNSASSYKYKYIVKIILLGRLKLVDYSSESKWLNTYRYSDSKLLPLCKRERKLHPPKATLCLLYRTELN